MKEEKRKGGRKPGDRSTAALEAALIFGLQSSAEPDCLKAKNSWICTKQEKKAIGQLAKKCLSFGGRWVSEAALLRDNLWDRKYLSGLGLSS